MKNLKHYQQIIKDLRKDTPYDEYVMDLLSWVPMNFYRNNEEISRYPDTSRSPKVVSNKKFGEMRDEMGKYSLEYNQSKTFFENFEVLFKNIPMPATVQQMEWENTQYSDMVVESRNAYLSNIVLWGSENIYYTFSAVLASRNAFSSCRVRQSENVYNSMGADNCSNIFYSKYITNSNNIWFSSNLVWCSECLFCNDLENLSYHIKNKEYSKEEYAQKKEELFNNKDEFENYYSQIQATPKNVACENSEGILLKECENITNASYMANVKNGNNLVFGWEWQNFYDCFDVWFQSSDFYWAVNAGTTSGNIYCSNMIETSYNIFYSYNINNCNHCFGCIGLVNKSYCILNKQYSKQDWENTVAEIMETMNTSGDLGKFFPHSLNPFYFNNTLAGIMSQTSKSEAEKQWFLWQDTESTKKFTHIQQEKDFCKKYNLPLPTKHWMERMREHLH